MTDKKSVFQDTLNLLKKKDDEIEESIEYLQKKFQPFYFQIGKTNIRMILKILPKHQAKRTLLKRLLLSPVLSKRKKKLHLKNPTLLKRSWISLKADSKFQKVQMKLPSP